MYLMSGFGLFSSDSNSPDRCPDSLKTMLRNRWWGGKTTGQCFVCGMKLQWDGNKVIGRIKPGSKGGKYTFGNCRIICHKCNSEMNETNLFTFMKNHYPKRYSAAQKKGDVPTNKSPIKKKKKREVKNPFTESPIF